jgi:hypothetical protein
MSQTLGLTGYAGAGKDTAAEALLKIGWERRAFADPLREGLLGCDPIVTAWAHVEYDDAGEGHTSVRVIHLSELIEDIGWDRAKREYPEVRRLQQTYGTEGGRHIHGSDCWLKAARATMLPGVDYVFTDCRFPNEVEMIHQAGGVVVRIDRTGVEAVNAHVSDDIGGLLVDFVIVNDGSVEELHARILDLFA